jgi:hypothetical protein
MEESLIFFQIESIVFKAFLAVELENGEKPKK